MRQCVPWHKQPRQTDMLHGVKHFMHILFHPPDSSRRQGLASCPFYGWKSQGQEKLMKLSKVSNRWRKQVCSPHLCGSKSWLLISAPPLFCLYAFWAGGGGESHLLYILPKYILTSSHHLTQNLRFPIGLKIHMLIRKILVLTNCCSTMGDSLMTGILSLSRKHKLANITPSHSKQPSVKKISFINQKIILRLDSCVGDLWPTVI